MKELEDFLKSEGMYPRVDFSDKQPHIIKIIKGKIEEFEDGNRAFRMLVEEDGELKVVSTPSVLIEIRKCKAGDVYSAQLKFKNIGGKTPIQTYIVKKVSEGQGKTEEGAKDPMDIKDDDIPILNEEGTTPTQEELDEMFSDK